MHFTEAQLLDLIGSFIWPLIRISAMFVAVPLFSITAVPARVRLVLSVVITLVMMPLLPNFAPPPLFSYEGFMIASVQVLIGLTTGFIMQLVFSAVIFAGQSVALGMGLGFASMIDPQNGQQVPVVAQFYVIATTLIFLSLDGHLVLIKMLLDSFKSLPIGMTGISQTDIWTIVSWSSRMLAGGMLLAFPITTSLLLVNMGFGVAARAAPQLNIFSAGFPITLLLGMLLIWLTLPNVLEQFGDILTDAYDLIEKMLRL